MFAQTAGCVDHGIIAAIGECCPGLTPWAYDANTGTAYAGFGCWNATCAGEGQFSPPAGISTGAGCCTGLVPIAGKCAKPQQQTPTCATVGKVPLATQTCCSGLQRDAQGICNAPSSTPTEEGGIFGIPTEYLMYGAIAVVAMMMLGKKR